jgi:DNA-binding NarL/FixJ family response regulator
MGVEETWLLLPDGDDAQLAAFGRSLQRHLPLGIKLAGTMKAAGALPADAPTVVLFAWAPAFGPKGRDLLPQLRADNDALVAIAVTRDGVVEERVEALESGVDDCVERACDAREIAARVRALRRRHAVIGRSFLAHRVQTMAATYRLSNREEQALILLAEGRHPKEIAGILGCGYATVRTHLQRLSKKIGCSGTREALTAVYAGRWRNQPCTQNDDW